MTIDQLLTLVLSHRWLALISALLLFGQHALRDKTDWCKWNVPDSVRAVLVLVLGAAGGAFDAAGNWTGLGSAFKTQLVLVGPSLLALVFDLVRNAASPVGRAKLAGVVRRQPSRLNVTNG